MSNVVSIGLPRRPDLAQRQADLLESFAQNRRRPQDVYWLKENAELLNVLATGGAHLPHSALDAYAAVYAGLEERLGFFPQYYRFLLSICLDLEDLGMEGDVGAKLCRRCDQMQLVGAELSDLQRAEAMYLMSRRNVGTPDPGLEERLHAFLDRSEVFALPNKKASYELTHIIFYLTHYGQREISLSSRARTSLEFSGLLAYLDQDVDLLAEVCVAMRFAALEPSMIWEDWLAREIGSFVLEPSRGSAAPDAYHEYLVTSWWAGFSGIDAFRGTCEPDGLFVARQAGPVGPLRAMSEYMFQLGPARSGDWSVMRPMLSDALDPEGHGILAGAEKSSPQFQAFFEGFARAEQI